MGKALRLTRRSRSGSVHGLSTYPYAPKVVHPRGKPLQRTLLTRLAYFEPDSWMHGHRPYSASDLRRLFASVSTGQNGTSSSAVHGDASFARRAAGSLERLIARLLHAAPTPPTLRVEGGHEVVLEPVLPLSRRLSDQTDDAESHSSWSSDRQLMRRELHLKRLGFVLTYSEYYFNWTLGLVSSVYATGRALVPGPLAGVAGSLEHRVTELSLPVISVVQDQSERVLSALDAKLDGVITTAAGVAGAPAAFLSGNNADKHAAGGSELDHVVAAKNAYLRAIEDAVQLVKEKGITGAAQCAADAVTATVSNAKNIPPLLEIEAKQLLYKVGDAWKRLIQVPPMSTLLAATAPSVEFAWHKYLAAHDAVVSAPTYNKAVGMGAEQLERVQGSYMYRALYPHISPYADPALDAVVSTGTFNALVDHLRPVQPAVTA